MQNIKSAYVFLTTWMGKPIYGWVTVGLILRHLSSTEEYTTHKNK